MLHYFEQIDRQRSLTPAVLVAALSACSTETVLLNSERIESNFGSYGIEVLASEAGLRRSSLYSIEDGERTCRTYAVVRFTDELDNSYGQEHAKVLAGNSLGEVFKANGWVVHKQTLFIGSFKVEQSAGGVGQLMKLAADSNLALHIYQLLIGRKEQVFEYATIIEAHHPDYLSEADLLNIYQYDDASALSENAVSELIAVLASSQGG